MAISEQIFQQVVLERLVNIEAQVASILELQAIQGEASNVQLNALFKVLDQSGLTSKLEPISLMDKYQQFFDTHHKRVTKEVVASLRNESDSINDDEDESVSDLKIIDIIQ